MRQLVRKPFTLALLLTLPLWIVFSNFVVALSVALLVAFLASMIDSLFVLKQAQAKKDEPPGP